MNILYLTEHLSHADFLEHELGKLAPHIHLDVSPKVDDALARVALPDRYEALLLDPVIQGNETLNLIAQIRRQDMPLAVIVLTGPADEDPPARLLEAGADDYVVKRPNFVKNLLLILDRLMNRRHPGGEKDFPPLEVLHTGEIERARHFFTRPTLVKFRAATLNAEGLISLPAAAQGRFPFDAVILDDATPGINLLRALKDIVGRAPDTPVILAVALGQDEVGAQGLRLGAASFVIKSGDYHQRLAVDLESAIRRRDLLREKTSLLSTEARLRMIIETVPACVTLLTSEGTFQAINWTGLTLVGAARIDQVVGKNLFSMVGPKQEGPLRKFISRICAGERGAIEFDWDGLDGVARRLELRAVPLRREPEAIPAVLGVLHDLKAVPHRAPAQQAPEAAAAPANAEQERRTRQAQWDEERKKHETDRLTALEALRASEAKLAQALTERQAEQTSWQTTRQEMEWQRTALEEALRSAEAGHARLEEECRRERAAWEDARRDLEQQLQEAGKSRQQALASARDLDIRQSWSGAQRPEGQADPWNTRTEPGREHAETAGSLAEAERLHASIEELLRSLEVSQGGAEDRSHTQGVESASMRPESPSLPHADAGQGVEERRAELEEQYRIERAEWDSACLELKRLRAEAEWKCAEMTQQRAAGSSAMNAGEEGDTGRSNQADPADWEKQRQQWEQQQSSLLATIAGLEKRLAEHSAQQQIERTEWDSAWLRLKEQLAESETKCADLVSRGAALGERLDTAAARTSDIDDRSRSEQASWEAARQSLEQQLQEAGEERVALGKMIAGLEEAVAAREQQHRADQTRWESVRSELDQERTSLRESLRGLEARLADLDQQRRAERTEWDTTSLALDRKRADAEDRRVEVEARNVSLAAALSAAESRSADLETQFGSKIAEHEGTRHVYEESDRQAREQRAALEAVIREQEERQRELENKHLAERAEWQRERAELERLKVESDSKRAELESRRDAHEEVLRVLEARCTELERQYQAELAGLSRIQKELEERESEVAQRRAGLDGIVAGLETRLADLMNQHRTEQEQWHGARLDLERQHSLSEAKRSELEVRCASLAAAIQSLDERSAEIGQQHQSALAELARMQQELEQQRRDAGEKQETLESMVRGLEARALEIQEQHRSEIAGLESARQDLEQQRAESESKRAEVEGRRTELEARCAELEDRCRTQQAESAGLIQELKRQQLDLAAGSQRLEQALAASEAERAGLLERQQRERSEWEELREELEHQRAARIALEEALHASEARNAEILEEQHAERMELQAAREEQEKQRADRLNMEEELRSSAARLAQLAAGQQRERTELAALRQELQHQRAARLALEGTLRAVESRQRTEPSAEIASSAMQALSELVARMNDCGELLVQGLAADDPRRLRAARLVEIAGHAGKLADRLLALGARKELADLNLAVTKTIESLRHQAGENVELISALFPRLPLIRAAQSAAEKLLRAAMMHARDSLPLGGMITVETLLPSPAGEPAAAPMVLLAVTASGANVQAPADTAALEPLVTACGGTLRILGDAVASTTIEIALPAGS